MDKVSDNLIIGTTDTFICHNPTFTKLVSLFQINSFGPKNSFKLFIFIAFFKKIKSAIKFRRIRV